MSYLSLIFPADRYNLDFDMTGCIIMLVLICLECLRVTKGGRASRVLLVLDVSLLVSCAMRTAMLFLCNTPELFEVGRAEVTLVVSNLGKYWSMALLFYLLLLLPRGDQIKGWQRAAILAPPTVLTVLILAPTTRALLFSFSEAGKIVRGPLYPTLVIYALGYFGMSTVAVVVLRKNLSRGRFALMLLATVVTIMGYVADIADPSIKSANFAMVLLLLVMFEALYDRDYEISVRSGLIDPLSGLGNRAAMRNNFPGLAGQELCVAMLDIDKFKHFNDEMGHRRGDEIIAGTGQTIRDQFGDDGYRYGGDEFLVMTGIDRADFLARLERVRVGIQELSGSEKNNVVHATIGYAFGSPTTVAEARLLIGQADKALYQGKSKGGNVLSAISEASA